MTAIIVDDELHCREVLRILLEMHCPDIEVLKECENGYIALEAIRQYNPDIVFMDIEMPGMNAFDTLQQLTVINFHVVFTTAYDQYAIKAIKFSALDYLLKPIDAEELVAAIAKASQHSQPTQLQQVEQLQHHLLQHDDDFKLIISNAEGSFFIPPAEIIYCEGRNNYTHFFLTRDRKIVCGKTLKEYENILCSHGFLRIHKSLLVNIHFIERFSASRTAVILKDSTLLEVSRRRKDEVVNALFNR
ncbi:MAG: LytTR family DNA-binding domain-containing protein [Chitinophagaceae bacterium]